MLGKTNVQAIAESDTGGTDFGGGIKGWQKMESGVTNNIFNVINKGGKLVALTDGKYILWTDTGETWNKINFDNQLSNDYYKVLDADYNGSEWVFCGIVDEDSTTSRGFLAFTRDFKTFTVQRLNVKGKIGNPTSGTGAIRYLTPIAVVYKDNYVSCLGFMSWLNSQYDSAKLKGIDASFRISRSNLQETLQVQMPYDIGVSIYGREYIQARDYSVLSDPIVKAKTSTLLVVRSFYRGGAGAGGGNSDISLWPYAVSKYDISGDITTPKYMNKSFFSSNATREYSSVFELGDSLFYDMNVGSSDYAYPEQRFSHALMLALSNAEARKGGTINEQYTKVNNATQYYSKVGFNPIDGVYFNNKYYLISKNEIVNFDKINNRTYSPYIGPEQPLLSGNDDSGSAADLEKVREDIKKFEERTFNISPENTQRKIEKAFGNIYIFGDNGYILKSSSEATSGDIAVLQYISARSALEQAKSYSDAKIKALEQRVMVLEGKHGIK